MFPEDLLGLPPDRDMEFAINSFQIRPQFLRHYIGWHCGARGIEEIAAGVLG